MRKSSGQRQIILQMLAVLLGLSLIMTTGMALAEGKPGAKVDAMEITHSP